MATCWLLRLLESRGFKVVAFADDVVILVGGKYLSTLWELMESAFGLLYRNLNKTKLVLFPRKYKVKTFRIPRLD